MTSRDHRQRRESCVTQENRVPSMVPRELKRWVQLFAAGKLAGGDPLFMILQTLTDHAKITIAPDMEALCGTLGSN